tara:strand:- start:193 stop:375 length:183 start_codon:yes stop_codon:yes gene_type:complete
MQMSFPFKNKEAKKKAQDKYLINTQKAGLVSVKVIVPKDKVEDLKSYAKELRLIHRAINS